MCVLFIILCHHECHRKLYPELEYTIGLYSVPTNIDQVYRSQFSVCVCSIKWYYCRFYRFHMEIFNSKNNNGVSIQWNCCRWPHTKPSGRHHPNRIHLYTNSVGHHVTGSRYVSFMFEQKTTNGHMYTKYYKILVQMNYDDDDENDNDNQQQLTYSFIWYIETKWQNIICWNRHNNNDE